jgi:hypothetical protein
MSEFQKELTTLLNTHSIDNETDTPDRILAQYLNDCLDAFGTLMNARKKQKNLGRVQEINDVNRV